MEITIRCRGDLPGQAADAVTSIDTRDLDAREASRVTSAVERLLAQGSQFGAGMVRYDVEVRGGADDLRSAVTVDDGDRHNPLYELLSAVGAR